MPSFVEPKVFLLGETTALHDNVTEMLNYIGASDWDTDAETDAELLTEIAGRLCYLAFGTELNPNVTRVRKGNSKYIGNILNVKHGSVLEHGTMNFAILGCTPVFTHELVRHRVGTAFSQRSGRFVRLDSISARWPKAFDAENGLVNEGQQEKLRSMAAGLLNEMEKFQIEASELLGLDDDGETFARLKKLTSSMRRFAPYGVTTDIFFSANHRALRHILEMRSSEHAEEEPQQIAPMLAKIVQKRYPAIYQDMTIKADGTIYFENSKV